RPLSAELIADRIDVVARAHGDLVDELDRIAASRAPVSELIAARLETLARRLRPAAQLRAELGDLDPKLLQAGVAVWAARRAAAIPAPLDDAS
ncbi:MAG: hypothetical protein ACRDRL_23290, partial [Sciscionella sp.]